MKTINSRALLHHLVLVLLCNLLLLPPSTALQLDPHTKSEVFHLFDRMQSFVRDFPPMKRHLHLVFGEVGVGKSTLLNWALGVTLHAVPSSLSGECCELIASNPDESIFTMGNGINPVTRSPSAYSPFGHNSTWVDFAGMRTTTTTSLHHSVEDRIRDFQDAFERTLIAKKADTLHPILVLGCDVVDRVLKTARVSVFGALDDLLAFFRPDLDQQTLADATTIVLTRCPLHVTTSAMTTKLLKVANIIPQGNIVRSIVEGGRLVLFAEPSTPGIVPPIDAKTLANLSTIATPLLVTDMQQALDEWNGNVPLTQALIQAVVEYITSGPLFTLMQQSTDEFVLDLITKRTDRERERVLFNVEYNLLGSDDAVSISELISKFRDFGFPLLDATALAEARRADDLLQFFVQRLPTSAQLEGFVDYRTHREIQRWVRRDWPALWDLLQQHMQTVRQSLGSKGKVQVYTFVAIFPAGSEIHQSYLTQSTIAIHLEDYHRVYSYSELKSMQSESAEGQGGLQFGDSDFGLDLSGSGKSTRSSSAAHRQISEAEKHQIQSYYTHKLDASSTSFKTEKEDMLLAVRRVMDVVKVGETRSGNTSAHKWAFVPSSEELYMEPFLLPLTRFQPVADTVLIKFDTILHQPQYVHLCDDPTFKSTTDHCKKQLQLFGTHNPRIGSWMTEVWMYDSDRWLRAATLQRDDVEKEKGVMAKRNNYILAFTRSTITSVQHDGEIREDLLLSMYANGDVSAENRMSSAVLLHVSLPKIVDAEYFCQLNSRGGITLRGQLPGNNNTLLFQLVYVEFDSPANQAMLAVQTDGSVVFSGSSGDQAVRKVISHQHGAVFVQLAWSKSNADLLVVEKGTVTHPPLFQHGGRNPHGDEFCAHEQGVYLERCQSALHQRRVAWDNTRDANNLQLRQDYSVKTAFPKVFVTLRANTIAVHPIGSAIPNYIQ